MEAKERQKEGLMRGGEKPVAIKRCQREDDQHKETLDIERGEGFSDRSTRTAHIAGSIVGVSGAVVERMKKVTEEAPELAEEVKSGEGGINQFD